METDAEILKEGTDALLEKLGAYGTMLFIAEIKSTFADVVAAFEGEVEKVGFKTEDELQEYIKDLHRRPDDM